jgi:hypothetical protein
VIWRSNSGFRGNKKEYASILQTMGEINDLERELIKV